MELGKIFILCVVFLFGVALFPILQDKLSNANVTGPMAPVIHNFPTIFLIIIIVVPIVFSIKEK